VHPYGSSMMNQYAFDMVRPLLLAQPYIESVEVWTGQQCYVDLDAHRTRQLGLPYGSIHRWIGYLHPDMQTDLSKPWIHINRYDNKSASLIYRLEEETDRVRDNYILINRTTRYNNQWLTYFSLEKYKDRLLFAGLPDEHEKFQKDWNFELPLLKVKDFYELAVAIKSCKFFIGNQSMCYAIAEGLKVPRILEVCDFAPNVIPHGENAYDMRLPGTLEYLVSKLDKEL